jgi:hypothetical protein
MKKPVLILLTTILISLGCFSQNDSNEITYKEVLNDPDKIPNFELVLSPLWANLSLTNIITGGWNIGTKLSVFKKFQFDASYGSTYGEKIFDGNYPGFIGSTEPYNFNYQHANKPAYTVSQDILPISMMDIGLSFTFNNKVRTSKDLVVLHQTQQNLGYANLISSNVTYVDVQLRRRWQARIGYFISTNTVKLGNIVDLIDDENFFEDKEGNKFFNRGIQYHDVDYNALSDKPTDKTNLTQPGGEGSDFFYDRESWTTSIKSSCIAFGLSREVIRNYIIDVEGYGKRGNQSIRRVYADVLIADVEVSKVSFFGSDPTATKYGDEMGTEIEEFDLSGSGEHKIETNPLGFRVGYESRGISPTKILPWADQDEVSKVLNLGYKTEIGICPGIKGKGLYFFMGLYATINTKI